VCVCVCVCVAVEDETRPSRRAGQRLQRLLPAPMASSTVPRALFGCCQALSYRPQRCLLRVTGLAWVLASGPGFHSPGATALPPNGASGLAEGAHRLPPFIKSKPAARQSQTLTTTRTDSFSNPRVPLAEHTITEKPQKNPEKNKKIPVSTTSATRARPVACPPLLHRLFSSNLPRYASRRSLGAPTCSFSRRESCLSTSNIYFVAAC